ncbi:MAG: outer membrane protein assembly factor BamD [Sedimenticola sp.]
MMVNIRSMMLLLVLSVLSGCSLLPKEEDKTKDWSAQQFYSEASFAMSDGDYETAIKYYEGLESRFPFGRFAMQAQLDVAYAYYKNDERESSIAAADRFIKLHPRNPYVDYAYYLKGLVNFTRNLTFINRFVPTDSSQRDPGSTLDAFIDFAELVRRFPESKYATDARKRMVYLRNNLARNEIHVARYYMKRGAYLAAVNRGITVVEKYQRTPSVKEAMTIMVTAYDKLGLKQLSTDTQRVLALNEAKGTFTQSIEEAQADEDKSLGRAVWDYLELDKN